MRLVAVADLDTLVGTPAGVTLAPKGAAHQSIISPSIGLTVTACLARRFRPVTS
jgi:pyruvate dehydrogenase complex dehydrogenase (E1) component